MENNLEKIRTYLHQNSNVDFDKLGIQDESKGKWVQSSQIANRFLIRHLHVNVAPELSTSKIGSFVYHQCADIIQVSGFWTTQKGHVSFFYSWNKKNKKKSADEKVLNDVLDCPNLVPIPYVKTIKSQLKYYSEMWNSPVVVKFGKTGTGRMPNYQIESIEDLHIQAFNGQSNDKRDKPYDHKKLTRSFTHAEYREFTSNIGIR